MAAYPGFIGPSYTSLSIRAAQERTVNFYVEQIETPYGKSKRVLYPTPGYVTRAIGGSQSGLSGGIRALYTSRVNYVGTQDTDKWFETCYAVVGDKLCQLAPWTDTPGNNGYALGARYIFHPLGTVEGVGEPVWTYRADTGQMIDEIAKAPFLVQTIDDEVMYGFVTWEPGEPSPQASADTLNLSYADADGDIDSAAQLGEARPGDYIRVHDAANHDHYQQFLVLSVVLNGPNLGVGVEPRYNSGHANFAADTRVEVVLERPRPPEDIGLLAWDNLQQQATALTIDWISNDRLDSTVIYQTAKAGDILVLQGQADPTNIIRYTVTGPANTAGSSAYRVPVTLLNVEGAAAFADREAFQLALNPTAPITPPKGFAGDQWPAVLTDNGDGGNQLAISSGGYLWVWADPFTQAVGVVKVDGLSDIACCASLDGFILALDVKNGVLHSSVLFDALNFPGLAIDQRTSAPDPWRWMIVQNSLLYVMGERTTDVYYNAGLANFPLAKHTGGTIPFGISAVQSAAVVGNGWMMLSRTAGGIGQVVFVIGQGAEVVSDHALDAAIEHYNRDANITDAMGESFEVLGHVFYLLTFPSANVSWLFDLQSKTWTEIASWDETHGFMAWRPHWHAVFEGRRLIGDRDRVLLYELDYTVATEGQDFVSHTSGPVFTTSETLIYRLRRAPSLFSENKRIFFNAMEVFLETGIGVPGATTTPGHDPLVSLFYSDDGGHSFTEAASKMSAGRAGDYRARVRWDRLGSARDRVFQVVVNDPVPWKLIDAAIEIRPGAGT